MNNIINTVLAGIAILATTVASAQNAGDALRYSEQIYGGTPRTMGMGGAFGAVGGDIGGININPAGIAVFKNSYFHISPSSNTIITKSNFVDTKTNASKYSLTNDNVGFVFSNDLGNDKGWSNLNFGFSYNTLNNFNQNIRLNTNAPKLSKTDEWAAKANGTEPSLLSDTISKLVYDNWLIDTKPGFKDQYNSLVSLNNLNQNINISSTGRMREYLFTMGTSYADVIYLGAALSVQNINYENTTIHSEKEIPETNNNLDYLNYTTHFKTYGTGFNLKIGGIVRPADFIRLGLSASLPTTFFLNEDYNESLSFRNSHELKNYEKNYSDKFSYQYKLRTPARVNASIALLYKKFGMITFDYEFVNHSNSELSASDYDYSPVNQTIMNSYKRASNLRAGAELRFGKLSLRGGCGYYGNPYSIDNNEKTTISYSGGIGFKEGNLAIDLAYISFNSSERYFPFEGNIDAYSTLTTIQNRFKVGITYKF